MIDNDYVLYGLPYYNNIGDTLIWQGELKLLEKVPHKCVGVCGWETYPKKKLRKNVIILITGGGYFGDLWRYGWEQTLEGLRYNVDNKIIILPSTIYYQDHELMRKDAEYLSKFKNLTICARDKVSLDVAERMFKNKSVLIPDMAFCMDEDILKKWSAHQPAKGVLLFKRKDKELPDNQIYIPEEEYDVHDWLPMEEQSSAEHRFWWFYWKLRRFFRTKSARTWYMDMMYKLFYRNIMTVEGLKQISQYKKIYTTRLHAMILGVMLGREIIMIDNKFGKLSSFYETWLLDCDNVAGVK